MISTAHNTKPFKLDSFRSSLQPRRAMNCVLATICIVCVCAIAVVSAIVVREYTLSEAYEKTHCRLLNVTYAEDQKCMYCTGAVDKSKDRKMDMCQPVLFPCLRLTVAFVVKGHSHHGLLYADTNQATGQDRRCSFSVCHKEHKSNIRDVEAFATEVASHENSTFHCFFDTETLDNAILHKSYSKMDVFHYLFWPSLAIIVCALIFLYVECHRKGMVVCPCGKAADQALPASENGNPVDRNTTLELRRNLYDDSKGRGHPHGHHTPHVRHA